MGLLKSHQRGDGGLVPHLLCAQIGKEYTQEVLQPVGPTWPIPEFADLPSRIETFFEGARLTSFISDSFYLSSTCIWSHFIAVLEKKQCSLHRLSRLLAQNPSNAMQIPELLNCYG